MKTLKQYCFEHAVEDEFCVMVLVALLTGLRRDECLGDGRKHYMTSRVIVAFTLISSEVLG